MEKSIAERLPQISSVVLVGCYATIAQVLLIREFLVVFYGNELCLGIIFGAWLLGVAIGAAVAGRVFKWLEAGIACFIVTFVAMCLVFPSQMIFVRQLRGIFDVPPGQYIPILTLLYSSAIIIIPFSFTIGFIFPFACKVFRGVTGDAATDIGSVYIAEALGSLLGGVLFTFVLVTRLSPFETVAVLNCAVFCNLLILLFVSRKTGRGKRFHAVVGIVCAVCFLVCLSLVLSRSICKVEDYFVSKRWNCFNPDIALVESTDSKYENIVIGSRGEQYFVYGNGQYAFTFPNEYGCAPIAHLVLTEHPNPKRVLLISGGMGGLIREMLKHRSIDELHYVELDPKLLEITEKYLPVLDKVALLDKRVHVYHVDGRYFVKQSIGKEKYDLIFANVPDPFTASLNRFYTREFFNEIKGVLAGDGVFAASISSAGTYIGEEVGSYTGSIYHTLHDVFKYVAVTPGMVNYYFASDAPGAVTTNIDTLAQRYRERNIQSPHFSEYHYQVYLPPERVQFLENKLGSKTGLRINTDKQPVTYYFSLMLWDRFSGGQLHRIFHDFQNVRSWFFLLPIVGLLVLRLGCVAVARCRVEDQQRFNSLAAIATAGFAGMAVEIILIFAFQNIYGYVFERIGLIVALFMFGLALGGYIANRIVLLGHGNFTRILLYLQTLIVLYVLTLPLLLQVFSRNFIGSEYIFMLLLVVAGMLTGLVFPIASKLHLLSGGKSLKTGFTAGMIDSSDHAGAFIGAVMTGVLFVPLLGMLGACAITAALNAVSMCLLIVNLLYMRKSV